VRRKIFENVSKNSDPRCWPEETTICYKISLVQRLITNLNVILYIGNILRRKIFENVSKNSDPDVGLRKLQYATGFH